MHSTGSHKAVNLIYLRWGAAFMLTGIILGAFGAHTLRDMLEPRSLESWKTGVLYQLIHGIGLIALGGLVGPMAGSKWILRLMVSGVMLFSGSIYLLSTCSNQLSDGILAVLGPATPLGGLCLILAWALFLFALFRTKVSD